MMKPGRQVVWAAVVTACAVVAHFGFFFFRDNFSGHYAVKFLSASALRGGEIPYWNFHDSGGQPLAGNPNALTFYPDSLLYGFLPTHVAFNLHFLIHLIAAFVAMRALCVARGVSRNAGNFAATVYVLSGVVISSTAFYNLIVYAALIPFAFYAVNRKSARLLGIACGLMGLAAEPLLTLGVAIAIAILAFGRMMLGRLIGAAIIAVIVASPQLVAYSEIAGEVERIAGFSATTVLNTSLTWTRVAEIFLWPLLGFLNDAGGGALRNRLYSTIFLGLIAIPALFRRSRYTVVAIVMLFFALGRNNPIVAVLVENFASIRLFRFPEKFVLVLVAALVVLIAAYFDRTRYPHVWGYLTLLPLIWVAYRALPIDWYAPYRLTPQASVRVYAPRQTATGAMPARDEYRLRATRREPLFAATAGLRYALVPSSDNMHSLLTRLARERFDAATPALKMRYLRIAGCNVPNALPSAFVVRLGLGAATLPKAVGLVEHPQFDERDAAVTPMKLHWFHSNGRVTGYAERGQSIVIDVEASSPSLLFVNQSYFRAWVARTATTELETLPIDIDRLGIIVPAGKHRVTLRFGRHRLAVVFAWIASLLWLVGTALVEKLDRRSGEVQRPADEDRASV